MISRRQVGNGFKPFPTDTLRKPTTQPTKLAKDRECFPKGAYTNLILPHRQLPPAWYLSIVIRCFRLSLKYTVNKKKTPLRKPCLPRACGPLYPKALRILPHRTIPS